VKRRKRGKLKKKRGGRKKREGRGAATSLGSQVGREKEMEEGKRQGEGGSNLYASLSYHRYVKKEKVYEKWEDDLSQSSAFIESKPEEKAWERIEG